MNSYRIYFLSALSIAVLVGGAMLWIASARYYPLVRITLPDQGELTFIDAPWINQKKCQAANSKISDAIRQNCSQCLIVESCEKQIDTPSEMALAGRSINNYVVHSGTLRIVINAGNVSKQTCTEMAEQIIRVKRQAARCVSPQ